MWEKATLGDCTSGPILDMPHFIFGGTEFLYPLNLSDLTALDGYLWGPLIKRAFFCDLLVARSMGPMRNHMYCTAYYVILLEGCLKMLPIT
jgi:hypothetical protein